MKAIANLVIITAMGGVLCACTIEQPKIWANQKMAEYLYNQGLQKLKSKDNRGAIADFTEVIKRQSSNFSAYTNRCVARFAIGEIEPAKLDCDRAVELNPKNGDARYNRAKLLHYLKEYQAAKKDWQLAALIYQQEGNMQRYQDAIEQSKKF